MDIYTDTFTKEALEGIIAFYKTPAGQKLIKKLPELMQKSMQLFQKLVISITPKIEKANKEMEKTLKELKRKSQE
jgi:hypothetical protein